MDADLLCGHLHHNYNIRQFTTKAAISRGPQGERQGTTADTKASERSLYCQYKYKYQTLINYNGHFFLPCRLESQVRSTVFTQIQTVVCNKDQNGTDAVILIEQQYIAFLCNAYCKLKTFNPLN